MKPKPHRVRPANLIDVYRFVAAMAIVWYHSNYYMKLGGSAVLVDKGKLVLISWALPFFYVVGARFGLGAFLREVSFEKLKVRLFGLLRLILVYGLAYEALRWVRFGSGHVWFEGVFESRGLVGGFWEVFISGNQSPVYFLSLILVFSVYAFLIGWLSRKFSKGLVVLGLSGLLALVLNPGSFVPTVLAFRLVGVNKQLAVLGLLVGFLYALVFQNVKVKVVETSALVRRLVFVALPLIVGLASLAFGRQTWPTAVGVVGFMGLVLWFGEVVGEIAGGFAARVSYWGQFYSLGIYLVHPLVLVGLDNLTPAALGLIGVRNPLLVFGVINLLGMVVSFLLARFLYRRLRWLVAI